MTNKNTIHFGTLGLKPGSEIKLADGDVRLLVASGDGTPENGGKLVMKPGVPRRYWSLPVMTRELLQGDYDPGMDIWKLWTFEGETLRARYSRMASES